MELCVPRTGDRISAKMSINRWVGVVGWSVLMSDFAGVWIWIWGGWLLDVFLVVWPIVNIAGISDINRILRG